MHGMFELRTECKAFLKKTGLLTAFCTLYRPRWWVRRAKCIITSRRRANGFLDGRYSRVKNLAGKYEGQRCFVVCTGPSLTVEDVEKLRGDYTFSMNSITKIFPQTSWRPSFYLIQDETAYVTLEKELQSYKLNTCFASDMLMDQLKLDEDYLVYPFDMLNHPANGLHGQPKFFFSDNAYAIIYDGFTVAYSAIQLAVYMGFKEIYLIGCDCNYSGEKKHFAEYNAPRTFVPSDSTKNMTKAYEMAKKYADEHGIIIRNATRGGKLEVFERVDFDELMKGK